MIEIEGYDDIVRIGHGGLGDVYRATRTSTGAVVAVKVLRDVSDESVAWHRTRRELTALVSLAGHAHVVQLLELIDLEQGPALVMEYAPGGSVADLMRRRSATLSVAEAVLVGRHTAAALVAAHARGIVHRDVKPQNLLIDAYGQVKLCDFGVAALTRSDEFRARTSALSMRYASPEDLDNEVDVGPPSDVYSLGATLLHLARGAPPTLRERLTPWEPPITDDADAAALDAVIAACLHPDPAGRPTAAAVLDDLEQLGWELDERQRALAFDPPLDATASPTPAEGAADATAVRSSNDAADDPTVLPAAAEPDTGPRPAAATLPRPPVPPRRARRLAVGAVGAAIAVVALVIAAVTWRDDAGDAGANATTAGDASRDVDVELVPRPSGLVDLTSVGWPIGPVGECLVQVGDRDEVVPVGCDDAHDLQRFLVGALDDERHPPGAPIEDARDEIRAACEDAFEPYTGVPFAASVLEAPFTMPTAAAWESGDRRYQCMVFAPGQRIVGDVGAG